VKKIVFDLEADGLLEDAASLHCICGKEVGSDNKFSLYLNNLNQESITAQFLLYDRIIGHNILAYDIPMIKKFYNVDLINLFGIENIVDTYVLSRLLHPDRELPKGCPTVIKNPVSGKSKKIGPHGLEAWGYRVGHKKIEIHDWRFFTEEIIDRCQTDCMINELVYFELMKEAGIL